jgi:hypothetical protein
MVTSQPPLVGEYTYGLSDKSSDLTPWSCTFGVDE